MKAKPSKRPTKTKKKSEKVGTPTENAGSTKKGELFYCDLCGAWMIDHHCKLVCSNCGYTRDCSDP